MKRIFALILCAAPAMAAISGTVVNGTTGKPLPGASVALLKMGQAGPELAGQATSDAQGKFAIDQEPAGASLIRAVHDGVTYNQMLPAGSPATGIVLEVFNVQPRPGAARVSKHMILFEPAGGQMSVTETFLLANPGKTAWNDPKNGTLRFYLPAAAAGKAQVNATPPGGLPIGAALVKTSSPDVYGVDFAIKPGETRIDLVYAVPYVDGAPYQGRIESQDENTYLIAPVGVALQGENLNDLGPEPRTQARIYGLQGKAYSIKLNGVAADTPAAEGAAAEDDGSPQIEQIYPQVAGRAPLIVGLALGILAVGFAMLYRARGGSPAAGEANERGRR